MLEILERITEKKGQEGDIELLIELGEQIRDTSLCGLGQTAPTCIYLQLDIFRHEYESHNHKDIVKREFAEGSFVPHVKVLVLLEWIFQDLFLHW
jgi:hypothetical protein